MKSQIDNLETRLAIAEHKTAIKNLTQTIMPNSTAEKPKFYTDKVAKAAIAKLEAENATLKAQLKARSATPAVKPVAQDLIAKQDPATKSNLTGIDRAIEAHKKSNK